MLKYLQLRFLRRIFDVQTMRDTLTTNTYSHENKRKRH